MSHIYPCVGTHQIEGTEAFYCLLRKTLAKWGKRNCQSSEAKCHQQDSNAGPPGRYSCVLPLSGHASQQDTFPTRQKTRWAVNSIYNGIQGNVIHQKAEYILPTAFTFGPALGESAVLTNCCVSCWLRVHTLHPLYRYILV